jgi:iron complex outermembrane receptor protein
MQLLRPAALALFALPAAQAQTLTEDRLRAVEVIEEVPPPDASPRRVVQGEALRRVTRDTLGASLEREPGVANAGFGPGVGLPVIRGLSGVRVRTMGNGMGSHDAAAASPDHAVTLEPILADRIEILRGPATVLFGSSAQGGAVNVIDGRIPDARAAVPLTGRLELRYDPVNEARTSAIRLDGGSGLLAVHADAFQRERGLTEIPGLQLDEAAVRGLFGPYAAFENSRGVIRNSDLDASGGSIGFSLVPEWGYAGLSVQTLANRYGIPSSGLPAHVHAGRPGVGGLETIDIDISQQRYDLRTEWFEPMARIDALGLHVQRSEYAHDEIEGGRVITQFINDVTETRATAQHRLARNWSGEAGLHHIDRDFSGAGEKSFVPHTRMDMLAAFLTNTVDLAPLALEFGLRREFTGMRPQERLRRAADGLMVALPDAIDFRTFTGTTALAWRREQTEWRFEYSHVERAPDIQELLALGPHHATRTYQVGDRLLGAEAARTFELGLDWETRHFGLNLNLFHRAIDDFIYLGFDPRLATIDPATGARRPLLYNMELARFQAFCTVVADCLPVQSFQQRDALFHGFEALLELPLTRRGGWQVDARLQADYVRGQFRDRAFGDVPRLPPLRAGGALTVALPDRFAGELFWLHAFRQDRAGLLEPPTAAFDQLDLDLAWHLRRPERGEATVFLEAANLLDAEIRQATSFLRSFAPEPGRRVLVGLRVQY